MADGNILHVAKGRTGDWKVLREGDAVATSHHPTKHDALAAAKLLASESGDILEIKVHRDDNSVEETLRVQEPLSNT